MCGGNPGPACTRVPPPLPLRDPRNPILVTCSGSRYAWRAPSPRQPLWGSITRSDWLGSPLSDLSVAYLFTRYQLGSVRHCCVGPCLQPRGVLSWIIKDQIINDRLPPTSWMDPAIWLHPIIRARLVRAGGMPSWQIAPIAAGAALIAATLAVITDRARAVHQQAPASTTRPPTADAAEPDSKAPSIERHTIRTITGSWGAQITGICNSRSRSEFARPQASPAQT